MKAVLREWSKDDDIWKRRTAILAQLKSKASDGHLPCWPTRSDPPSASRSSSCARASAGRLREYAKTDPAWVRAFVEAHPELSDLSRREALKHLERTNAASR